MAGHQLQHGGGLLCAVLFGLGVPATAGAHLKDGVLHVANLYAGAVIGRLAGEKGFEPEQDMRRGNETCTRTHGVQDLSPPDDRCVCPQL